MPYRQLKRAATANAVVFEVRSGGMFTTTAFGGAPIYAFMRDRRGERLVADLTERITRSGSREKAPMPRPRLDVLPVAIGAALVAALVAACVAASS